MEGLEQIVARLTAAGCINPLDEAAALALAADGDERNLESMAARRERGEPLAWIIGTVEFGGIELRIDEGVYVPRAQTLALAQRAQRQLPETGVAVDLCTGCGAIAAVLSRSTPGARVLAADLDPAAVACARTNGVDAVVSDLDDALPSELDGRVDVVTAVPPYVPDAAFRLLPRDIQAWEPRLALLGGVDGLDVARCVVSAAGRLLRSGGRLLIEIGGDQAGALRITLETAGFTDVEVLRDAEGDDRGIEATASR